MTVQSKPAGWYYGWNVVAVLIVSQLAANAMTYYSFPLFVPVWSAEMHAPPSEFHLCIMAMLIGASPASVLAGALIDKYPARLLFGLGLAGMAVFYAAVSFATAPWQIITLYGVIASVALVMCTAVPANAVIARWFKRSLGLALGLSTCGIGLAAAVVPKLVAAALPDLGWRTVWRISAGVVLLVVLPLVTSVLRDRPTVREGFHYLNDDGAAPAAHGHGASTANAKITYGQIMTRAPFWILVIAYVVMIGSGTAFIQNFAVYGKTRGITTGDVGSMIAAVGVAHVFAALIMGVLADRFGNRLPLAGMALAVVAGIACLAWGHSLPVLVLGAGLIGLNAAVFTPLSSAIATEFGPDDFGKAFGLAMLFVPLTQVFPYLVARQFEASGSYAVGMAACAVLLVLVSALSLTLKERPRTA
ncbi:MAG: MFS transporter [Sphingomonadales bacterium]|nr:MFS transporter [Sphingomonadales bacterium]